MIDVQVSGTDRFAARLTATTERLFDLRPLADDFVTIMLRSGRRRFQGGRLHRTGALERALTRRGARGQKIDASSPTRFTFGLHQRGSGYRARPAFYGHILNRRYDLIGLSSAEHADVLERVHAYLIGAR